MVLNARLQSLDGDAVVLSDGQRVDARTVVWTAGNAANPALADVPCAMERGRIVVDPFLRVPGLPGVWALGDCAHIPDPASGGAFPPRRSSPATSC